MSATVGPVRFMLSMPLEIEPVLESLLGPVTLALPIVARSQAAGDYVATLIAAERARTPVSRKPYEAPAATRRKAARLVEDANPVPVPPRVRTSTVAANIVKPQFKKQQAALAKVRSAKPAAVAPRRRKPAEPRED